MYVNNYLCIYVVFEDQRLMWVSSSIASPFYFYDRVTEIMLTDWLESYFCLPIAEILSVYYSAWICTWVLVI